MKELIKALVIMAVIVALVKGPGPEWYQRLRTAVAGDNAQTAVVPRSGRDLDDSVDAAALTHRSHSDDPRLLAAFEDNYQPAPGCDGAEGSQQRQCESHRRRTLDAFRSRWLSYYER